MSDVTPPGMRKLSSSFNFWRLLRLCRKELRESLRDRRTIVTLVLMPLLVYPLLSLVLNRVLVTGFTQNREPVVTFGLAEELSDSGLKSVLELGYGLLSDRLTTPAFLEETVQSDASLAAIQTTPPPALPRPQLLMLSDNGQEALRLNSVDLVVVRKATSNVSQQGALDGMLNELKNTGQLPKNFDTTAYRELVGNYEVRYRQGDQQSERAFQLLERILAAVNNEASRGLMGGRFDVPFKLSVTPVTARANYADLLATMVPLVLVLMTMAGAVYPAIDLTAGERERGTMEALVVSPTPTSILLFAKYVAVVVVALLTALANLTAMTVTLWVSGIGGMVFGDDVLSIGTIGTVLLLLVLFTLFFAALLLAVTSFAKSFKEAQAYLIPLMLLALAPGVMSLLPGIKFSGMMATVPLVNIVLLARQVLMGGAELNTTLIAVICNGVYALAAIALASKLFGSDAAISGSQGSWRDLLMRPRQWQIYPRFDQMAMTMAVMFPAYFILSSLLPSLSDEITVKLWMSVAVSFLLIFFVPLGVCWYRRIRFRYTFRLKMPSAQMSMYVLPAVGLIGFSAWMVAYEIIMLGQSIGIGTIGEEQVEMLSSFRQRLQSLPLWQVLFVLAITPAICEEVLFRGFVLSSFHRSSTIWAVVVTSVLFGLMHVLTSNVLAIERFFPATFMGLILGLIAVKTGSLWPGMVVHALHNGFLMVVAHYQTTIEQWGILHAEGEHLPISWLITGMVMLATGVTLICFSNRSKRPVADELAASPVAGV